MKYLVTSAEMKEYDNNTIEKIGIPGPVLMERAAMSVREEICRLTKEVEALRGKEHYPVLIAVGNGNNGADGLALARLLKEEALQEKYQVSVLLCGSEENETADFKRQREILTHYHVRYLPDAEEIPCFEEAASEYDFIIDGIFGVGLSRTVSDRYEKIICRLNQAAGIKIAIDIPSGIDGSTGAVMGCAFRADYTVSFGFGKRGLYLFPGAEYAGQVMIAEIGIDEKAFFGRVPGMFTYDRCSQDEESITRKRKSDSLLPGRKADGNKSTFGKVLLIAGWEYMAGAAILSAKAVLQTGAGMLKVYCSEANRTILQSTVPEAMYTNAETLQRDLQWADVIAVGPGLGQSGEAFLALREVLAQSEKSIVLDADAINVLSGSEELKQLLREKKKAMNTEKADTAGAVIMTPHPGELSRLSGRNIAYLKTHLSEVAKEVGLDYDSVMVCKDARTVVSAPGKPCYLNTTGNSGMATAGSGDVLTGIIASLLAQGVPAFEAGCNGVYLHGLAGDDAAEIYTEYGVTAARIISQLKEITI